MKNKVSIIVPIYNCEKFIKKCIHSIVNQSYRNIEIILVNDGSTDESEKICKKYKREDSRIKYYSKKNGGVSSARNYGIHKATGEYLMFLDADDYIDKDYIKTLLTSAIQFESDLVISDYTEINNGKKIQKFEEELNQSPVNKLEQNKFMSLYLKSAHFNSSCRKLVAREIVKKNKIVFNEDLNYGEDMLFSFEVYIKAENPIYVADFGYYYFIHSNSSMHRESMELFEKHYCDNLFIYNYIKNKYDLPDHYLNCLGYKTFVTFNKISRRVCDSNYKIINKIDLLKKQRERYCEIFNNGSIANYCNWKQKISYKLLKFNKIYLYAIIKIMIK